MPVWVQIVLQYAHIFFAIFWFGGVLTADFLILPVLSGLKPDTQKEFSVPFGARVERVVIPVAAIVILLGIVRGISVNVFSRFDVAYGWTWLASLIVGLGLLSMLPIISSQVHRLQATEAGPQFAALLDRIKALTVVELLGFLVILGLMIAMRFGY
ncbi:MAG: hypothetical protein E6I70_01650 [Chloroflexi bacterium]|nr:MAG: hypothetical protein E6I70_01650 [Chloroflexota bacterium]